eukprot:TRINITY_DN3932_c0_g1_i1.p1 TRINITY_DN3932_c0_g1~~TRINITY_DN3932_c0_g1_i1.p1  ORF type:complete len:130 (-),score=17.10 TRINITY_DN3932_c0_g1_i1:102-491(-)
MVVLTLISLALVGVGLYDWLHSIPQIVTVTEYDITRFTTDGVSVPITAVAISFLWIVGGVFMAVMGKECNLYLFLVVQIVSLLGQALGPLNDAYFFWASNFWEVVFFASLIAIDHIVLSQQTIDHAEIM